MKLSNEDAKLFYELFFPLLDYVNREYHILPEEDYFGQGMIDPQDAAEVAHFLWDRTWIIDDYLERSDLPEEHIEILKSWKGCITGRFIIERNLKKGSVFISIDDNSVFLVNGIVSSWEEMLRNAPMPTLLDAALLPFKNAIISDGLVSVIPIIFGPNSKADFKEIYMDAKRNGEIKARI
ncbi:hypothetical protein [Ruminococcus albus]|uniref:Uncharacterized protein n=1 Tax=Ruminococcus albus TaxID=1264 RepID=A0A1I1FE50_RUMAL|nr:hypothetical protein [Ruminococcus albus]SFB97677.1 hypothetical protein SAMN02910406_00947 [Ruminococcus albus]